MAPRPLQVVVLGDVSCPWCYISKRRLSKAMSICAQASFEVHWVPFPWGPNAPKEGVSKWEYLTGVVGAQKLQELFPVASKAYEKEGLSLTLEGLTGCNMDAHRLLAWAADRHGRRRAWDLLEGIYNAYHCHGLYVGSSPEGHVNLLAAAERAGLPRAEAAAVLAEPGVYAERVRSDMAAHKGVKAIPRVEIAGRLRLSGCKTVAQYVTAIRAALRDMEDEQAPAAGSPRCARQREEVAAAAGTARLPQLPSTPCSPWPSAGALRPQPQPRSGSPVPHAQPPSQPKPQAQQAQQPPPPHSPQQPSSPQARPMAATGSPPRCQAQALGPGAGSGSGPGPKRASPSLTSAATRSSAANPLQQLLQAHAAAAATTSRFQRSSSGPHMLHHRTLTGGGGGGGVWDVGMAGGGRPQQASGLSTTRRQFGSGLHADCSAHAGTEVLQVRVTAAPGVESGCPSASAPITWMDSVEPMSPTQGLPSGAAFAGAGAGSGGRGGGRTPGAFTQSSDGGVTGGGCAAAASPRTRMARVSSDRDGPGSAGAASYSSPARGAYGVVDVAVEDVSSPAGSAAEQQQQQQPRRHRRPPAKGKSLLQLVRSDLAAGAGAGGGGGGGVMGGGDRAERVESAVQVLQLLHSNLLGGGGASSGSSGGGGGRDVSPSSRSLLAGRLGVGGSSNRVRVGATDREGALIATALQRKTFRERAVASSDGTTDVFPQPGMLGSPGEDGGVGRLGRAAATAVRAAGGGGGGGGGDADRTAAVASPGGPPAGGSGPTLKHGPTGRSLLGVGSTSSHYHLHHHYQYPHQHSPQRVQYDRSASLGLGGGVSPSGGSGASPSCGGAGSDSGSGGAGAGGLANSAPGPHTRFSYSGGAALIPSMLGGAAAAAVVGSGGQVVGGAGPNRSQSPGNQVLHISPSGRLPATQEAGGRAADAPGAAPPHFASGPLTLAAAPAATSAAAAAAAMPPPVRLVLDTAAFAGGRGAAAGSSDGRDSHGVPLAHSGGLSAVAPSPGGGASSRLVSASRSPSGAPPSPSVLSFTPRLALSEVTAATSLLSGSPRAGGTAGAAGPAATPTPSPPHSHASNKVAPAPVTISVSARLPEVAAAPSGPAPQRPLSRSSAPAVAQPASPQPLQPQPQPLQPPQPAGSKPADRVVTLTGTRAVGAGGMPLVARPSSPGVGSGWAGAPVPVAGAAANGESRTTSGNSSVGDGASGSGGSRRKLKSFLPPLLARLFG